MTETSPAQSATRGDAAPIIEVEHLERTFHLSRTARVTALDDVSCALRAGTCLAVVGESGSGKSTLARVIVGLETADAGEVRIAGTPVRPTTSRRALHERAKLVQMVFQDPQGSLNRSLPVAATINEMLQAHRPDLDRAGRRARLLELFAEVGLTERHADAKPEALSGGQKQRVAIARALAAEPEVLVLDEAVSALDVSVQAQVLDLLKRLRSEHGLSYLFITHDLSVVRDIADDVVVMRTGRIIERGTVSDILDRPTDPYTRLLLASAPRPGWKPRRGLRDALIGGADRTP
ncbi:ATP-binding cassette domain-containing protein [Leucobacter alluvii]|uniref:ATP-binding cassette domain-containing protein n=1 Tax=Leucobacter alluvii TaxID=340321 RepID=A0ABN3B7N8_9MICO